MRANLRKITSSVTGGLSKAARAGAGIQGVAGVACLAAGADLLWGVGVALLVVGGFLLVGAWASR